MHDPLTLAFTVPGPWLRRDYRKRLRFGRMIKIWHHDPSDNGTDTCRGKHWRWHVHHWRPRFEPWFTFRRWAFTRCAWCGGKSRKGDYVNISHQWDSRDPWWKGERSLFHSGCSSVASAHRQCTCALNAGGPWRYDLGGLPYGDCVTCGKYRGWRSEEQERESPRRITEAMFASVPVGERPTRQMLNLSARLWREYRAERSGA